MASILRYWKPLSGHLFLQYGSTAGFFCTFFHSALPPSYKRTLPRTALHRKKKRAKRACPAGHTNYTVRESVRNFWFAVHSDNEFFFWRMIRKFLIRSAVHTWSLGNPPYAHCAYFFPPHYPFNVPPGSLDYWRVPLISAVLSVSYAPSANTARSGDLVVCLYCSEMETLPVVRAHALPPPNVAGRGGGGGGDVSCWQTHAVYSLIPH
jgi:hypothetical protein